MTIKGKVVKSESANYTTKSGREVLQDRLTVKDIDGTGLLDAVEISVPSGSNIPVGKVYLFDIADIFGGGTQRFKFGIHSMTEVK